MKAFHPPKKSCHGHSAAARKLLYQLASAITASLRLALETRHMLLTFITPFGARLCHGRVAGANRMDRRVGASSRLAPPPGGSDTARPTCR